MPFVLSNDKGFWIASQDNIGADFAAQYAGDSAFNTGEEGVFFEYDETGTPKYTALVTKNPEGLSKMQAQWLYTNFQASYVQNSDARVQ